MYKLAIEDTVEVPVKFTLKAGRINKQFACTLFAKRFSKDEIEAEKGNLLIKDFLMESVFDWRDQRLVLDANDQPADFSKEAFEVFLCAPGVTELTWAAYKREVGAKEKN